MLIGIDFDNTIVRYDRLFHTAASELGLITADVPVSKLAVRDVLRASGREDAWTELQGQVYGPRLREAEAFEGFADFLRHASAGGHECVIVSHKTRYPYLGPRFDLHAAAEDWIATYLVEQGKRLIDDGRVFFHETKQEKLARIGTLGCAVFIDDLPEILQAEGFPRSVRGILFDPDNHHEGWTSDRASDWFQLEKMLFS